MIWGRHNFSLLLMKKVFFLDNLFFRLSSMTLLTLKRKRKHYIEDLIFKNLKKLFKKIFIKLKRGAKRIKTFLKNVLITKILKTFDFFPQKSQNKNYVSCGIIQQGQGGFSGNELVQQETCTSD